MANIHVHVKGTIFRTKDSVSHVAIGSRCMHVKFSVPLLLNGKYTVHENHNTFQFV